MRAVVYTRVSSPGQADGTSLQTQREECEKKARSLGAEEIVYLEDTYTGAELDRKAMNQLRTMVRNREVDLVVVYDPDRFSRNLYDLLMVVKELDRAGVRLEFVNFEWEKTPQGILFLQLRGAIAEFERAMIRERTSRGKLKNAREGRLRGWCEPYGYRYDPELHLPVPDPEEVENVRLIFRLIAEGNSPYEVAKILAEKEIPAPRGSKKYWYASTIARMVRREFYCTGRLVRKDEKPDWKPVVFEPIIFRELFEKANKALDRRKTFNPKRTKHTYLCQRLVWCGICGHKMVVNTKVKPDKVYSYYKCSGKLSPSGVVGAGIVRCKQKDAPTHLVDGVVWDVLRKVLSNPENYIPYLKEDFDMENLEANYRRAREELERAQKALERVDRAWFDGILVEEDAYRKYREEHAARFKAAEQKLRTLEKMKKEREGAQLSLEAIREAAREIAAGLDDMSDDEKRSLVRELVEKVVIKENKISIFGKLGLGAVSFSAFESLPQNEDPVRL